MKKSPPLTQPATPPPPAKTMRQTDPTSILFHHKAYDIQIDTAHDPVRYWFADKSGPRYILIRDGNRRVARRPV
jgi:hypothetical protein